MPRRAGAHLGLATGMAPRAPPTTSSELLDGMGVAAGDRRVHQDVVVDLALKGGLPKGCPTETWIDNELITCTTSDIEQATHGGHDTIVAFLEDEHASFLTLD